MSSATSPTAAPAPKAGATRLLALDALRGFTMFWIIGADDLVHALHELSRTGLAGFLGYELSHADWEGFRFYDLIFPMFVFIVGVSIVFSVGRLVEREGRPAALRRILVRGLLLYGVAILYYGGFSMAWPHIRLVGVLQRIAVCYVVAGIAFMVFSRRGLVVLTVILLAGYWAMMSFVSFPDVRPVPGTTQAVTKETGFKSADDLNLASTNRLRGVFLPGVNLAHYVDQAWLPGFRWDGTWDPEGLLSTLPAIATCLLGVLAGLFLGSERADARSKARSLVIAGVVCVGLGFLWGVQFPVIKKIWTSSYVLVAGGYSCILLGVFYQMIEIWQWRRWCLPFVWIGVNPITIYLATNVVDMGALSSRFVGGDIRRFFDSTFAPGTGQVVIALFSLFLSLAFCRWLYRRGIFLRL